MVDDNGFPGTFHRAPDYPLTEIRIKVETDQGPRLPCTTGVFAGRGGQHPRSANIAFRLQGFQLCVEKSQQPLRRCDT